MTVKARTEERTVLTPEFRAAFTHVFSKAPPIPGSNQEPKYSCVLLFPKSTDLSALKQALVIAAQDKWGDNIPQGMKNPIRDGDEHNNNREAMGKNRLEGYDDHYFITATSIDRPGVVNEQVEEIINPEEFYAGCYARAQVYAHAYSTAGNIGVTFFLNHIQKTRDGDRFSGRKSPKDIFDKMGPAPSPTPTNGAADSLFD